MYIFRYIIIIVLTSFLAGCVMAPMPGTGTTVEKLSSRCVVSHQPAKISNDYIGKASGVIALVSRHKDSSNIYSLYVPDTKNSSAGTICRFDVANVYFPRLAWNELKKTLSTYPSDTAIRPLFDDMYPSSYIVGLWLVSPISKNQLEYNILTFNNGKWGKKMIDSRVARSFR